MNKIFISIAIIVGLVFIFVIIDRKDFIVCGDVQTVQYESYVSNRNTISVSVPETKSATELKSAVNAKRDEGKSVETNPVVEAQTVTESRPKTDEKPAEMTSGINNNDMPVEIMPVAENKDGAKPFAIPIATSEEAEKLNANAIEFMIGERIRREPFYSLYEKNREEFIALEGTINIVSSVPIPSENDYNDCLYSVFMELESMISDPPSGKAPSKGIIVNVPIMKDKKIIKDNILYPGDKVFITAAEYDAMPQEIQEIQLSDDIQSFEHQYYFAKTLQKITSFSAGGNSDFATREISILPIQTLPKDEAVVKSRKERIHKEIVRIEDELRKHGGSFAKWKNEYKPIANRYSKLCEEGYKGWINNAYFAAAGLETINYDTKQYLSGIIPYKKYLEERNIDLIVVRIPSKWDFAARVLSSESFQENPAWIEFYYELLKNDIEIIDPMYEMWKERFDHPLFYFYQYDKEFHPFEGMYLAAAKLLSEVLSRYKFEKDDVINWGDAVLEADLLDEMRHYPLGNSLFCDENGEPRQLTFKCILSKNERVGHLKKCSGSPFLCLSNSLFGAPFMQDQSASFPHYLSCYLQHMVDWKYQSGIRNEMLRILLSDTYALNNRKAVIMVGGFDLFADGFPSIPKYLLENAEMLVYIETISIDSILKTNNDTFETRVESGVSMFRAKQDIICFDIEIPPMPKHKTCMIRINIPVALSFGTTRISVFDSKDKELDFTYFVIGNDIKSDLCIPASEIKQKVSVVITPRKGLGFTFGIKNIELWGF